MMWSKLTDGKFKDFWKDDASETYHLMESIWWFAGNFIRYFAFCIWLRILFPPFFLSILFNLSKFVQNAAILSSCSSGWGAGISHL